MNFAEWLETQQDITYIRIKFSSDWDAASFGASFGLEPNAPSSMTQIYDGNDKNILLTVPEEQVKQVVLFLRQCLKKYGLRGRISLS